MKHSLQDLKSHAQMLRRETCALSIALHDPRTPWYAKALTTLVLAYALSPIDLIPDFIPVFGYLDDVLIVPLGVALAMKMIPAEVMYEARNKAAQNQAKSTVLGRIGMVVVILIWILVLTWLIWQLYRLLSTIKG